MSLEDFHREAQANAQRQQDIMRHQMELAQERNLQQSLHTQTLNFQKEQTDRFIKEYQETNKRLLDINVSLQKQIDEAKQEADSAKRGAKIASIRSWISVGISIAAVGASIVFGVLSLVL